MNQALCLFRYIIYLKRKVKNMKYSDDDDIKNFNNMQKLLQEVIEKEEDGVIGLTTSVSSYELKEMLNWAQYKLALYKSFGESYINGAKIEPQATTEWDAVNEKNKLKKM